MSSSVDAPCPPILTAAPQLCSARGFCPPFLGAGFLSGSHRR